MKHALFAIALGLTATTALADGPGTIIMEPDIVIADTVENAGNDEWAGGLLVFLVLIAALGS